MTIRILPTALVNQIAAGEVVERPASVAKELIENSLDAGATKLIVRIEGGGRERLEIIDDGGGIAQEELVLALAPHATSKISTSDDLNRINTFGFRGEALCAISSVAHVRITSAVRSASQAWMIESRFGQMSETKPAAGRVGTTIEVLGLFNNVPARRKFLRGDPAEAARVTEVVCNAALAHPTVSFRLESGGRKVLDFAAAKDVFGRVADVFGDALGESPLTVAGEAEGDDLKSRIIGVTCRPESMRSVSRTQRIMVNGRPIVDRSLIHAVREAYRGLAEPSLQPVFVIFLQVDPEMVDVNVHPQKSEVRWRNPAWMHRLVYRSVQDALRAADLTAGGSSLLSSTQSDPAATIDMTSTHHARQSNWSSRAPRSMPSMPSMPRDSSGSSAVRTQSIPAFIGDSSVFETPAHERLLPTPAVAVREVLQVDNTWLILAEGDALVIVDQHALHERVMFEEIRARIGSGDLMSQRLLVPAMADVPPEALAHLETFAPLFARLGIEATAAGPRTVAVHAFPGFLTGRKVDAATFVARVLTSDALASASDSTEDSALREGALADVLDMMACKAAVKGGDRLSVAEITRLLDDRATTDRSTNCPHGRPTSIRIPMSDIERRFGRR
ncbi:DNA mismatch repair protein MutL [Phycisphaerae bacterium]|nr:DNA mismatch repair protein MutL [Phycisphaerae bacterium]